MHKVRIKPCFSTITHSPDMVELRQGVWNSVSHLLKDDEQEGILASIIQGIGNEKDPAEIATSLNISRSRVEAITDYLQQLGVLQSTAESFIDYYIDHLVPTLKRPGVNQYPVSRPVIFLGNSDINQKIITQLKNITRITVKNEAGLWEKICSGGDAWLFDALAQEQFITEFSAWQNHFLVFSSTHVDPVLATRINRIAMTLNIPWIHLALDGPFLLIGPTFHGKNTACHDCFETRISMNLRESASYQKYKNALAKGLVCHHEDPLNRLTSPLLSAHACLEILNFLTTGCTFTTNRVLSIFLPTMEFVYHDVLKLSACRTCGSVAHRDDTQLHFDFQQLLQQNNPEISHTTEKSGARP